MDSGQSIVRATSTAGPPSFHKMRVHANAPEEANSAMAAEVESLRNIFPPKKGGRSGRPVGLVARVRDQFENVSQALMSPLFKPAVSHF